MGILREKKPRITPRPDLIDRVMGWKWRLKNYFVAGHVSDGAPVMVGGCPRSGTTLMRTILDTHPNICCGPESSLMRLGALSSGKLAVRFDFPRDYVRTMARESHSQAEFIDRFFLEYRSRFGKPRWAEKSPRNVLRLPYIRKHFPKSRFIHMIRDGRDVVCSLRTHPRFRVINGEFVDANTWNPIKPCIRRWVHCVETGLAHRGEPWYTEVRYEDLINDSEGTLRRLFEFLEEDWDPAVLDFHRVKSESRDVVKFPQNPEVKRPMYTSAMGRWRRDLTIDEQGLFKAMASDLLVKVGYEKDDQWEVGPAVDCESDSDSDRHT